MAALKADLMTSTVGPARTGTDRSLLMLVLLLPGTSALTHVPAGSLSELTAALLLAAGASLPRVGTSSMRMAMREAQAVESRRTTLRRRTCRGPRRGRGGDRWHRHPRTAVQRRVAPLKLEGPTRLSPSFPSTHRYGLLQRWQKLRHVSATQGDSNPLVQLGLYALYLPL